MKSSYVSLVAKYRPMRLSDIHDTELRESIETLLDMEEMYLLITGTPGSGKSTVCQAILREYYQLGPQESISESQVMFIHTLKDNGINFYRNDMKTFCQSVNGGHRKKTIIIDDIDTINEQSQHVFRNFMDQYRNNIQFICTATNEQKVIESLQSRLYIVRIQPPSKTLLRETLAHVCLNESIRFENPDRSAAILLGRCQGSIRYLLNDLEKIKLLGRHKEEQEQEQGDEDKKEQGDEDKKEQEQEQEKERRDEQEKQKEQEQEGLQDEVVDRLCSVISSTTFERYIACLYANDVAGAIAIFTEVYEFGYSVIDILEYFFAFVKSTDLVSEKLKYDFVPVFCKYITIFHNVHEDIIELSLFTNNLMGVFDAPV
jgi:DNA polymerase III delta prime subunit